MKVTYDPTVDAAYISLKSDNDSSDHGFTYCCDPNEVDGQVHLDFDSEGRLTGVEVLQASNKLPRHLLANKGTD